MKTLIDNKKYTNTMLKLIATVQLKKHGVECYLENATAAMATGSSKSEILEALKKDVDKTAGTVLRTQPIIHSIEDGVVKEFDSAYNSIEDVFGSCYNKEKNEITLSGIVFNLSQNKYRTKADFAEEILKNLFNIDKKELNSTIKSLVKYEQVEDDIEKAILYPTVVMADEMLKKIASEDVKFEAYRKTMSFDEKLEFDTTFKRTGIEGVIQNSTYVDTDGVQQLAKSHTMFNAIELRKLLKSDLKYIEAIEVDAEGSLEKVHHLVKQVEKLKLNTKVKFTFKARKLGNYKARGLFMQNQLIVAEDVRDTSAVIHEIGHLIHLTNLNENRFVDYMIDKLTPMIELDDETPPSKEIYYKTPTEVVARACEIAALFAKEEGDLVIDDDDFEIIKSREYYTFYEGIYFNFTAFDKTTKKEMLQLFKLFYQTAPDETVESDYDNFIKIDTQYNKVQKELGFYELLRKEQQKQKKELKALYANVSSSTISMIFENRKTADLIELAKKILINVQYCGDHKERMTAPEWMEVIEDKAGVINFTLDYIENNTSKKEFVLFQLDVEKYAWRYIRKEILFEGFTQKFRVRLREEFQKNDTPHFDAFKEIYSHQMYAKKIVESLDEEMLSDHKFIRELVDGDNIRVAYLDSSKMDIEFLENLNREILEKNQMRSHLINTGLVEKSNQFAKWAIDYKRTCMAYASESFKNNKELMTWFFEKYGYEKHTIFFLGDSLKKDVQFVKHIISKNQVLIECFPKEVQEAEEIAAMFNPEEVELKKIEGAKASERKKIARKTKSMKVLEVLSKDKNYDVRAEVAKNENAAIGTLLNLGKLKNRWVKCALALNKNTPKSILEQLAKEDDEYVLLNLADNPSYKKETKTPKYEEDFELLVEAEAQTDDFESLVENGEIVEFERTDGKGTEKVLKLEKTISDFRAFSRYMKSNKIGYYSRIAKGFILYKEYVEYVEKKLSDNKNIAAATTATALYSADILQNFANGTLF